jgi:hypothetical protein
MVTDIDRGICQALTALDVVKFQFFGVAAQWARRGVL